MLHSKIYLFRFIQLWLSVVSVGISLQLNFYVAAKIKELSNELQLTVEEEQSQRRWGVYNPQTIFTPQTVARGWRSRCCACVHRHLEEKITESERRREEMERQMADLQEENEQLQKAQLSESEAKNKLRQETSRLTAENMVCVKGHAHDCIRVYMHSFSFFPKHTCINKGTPHQKQYNNTIYNINKRLEKCKGNIFCGPKCRSVHLNLMCSNIFLFQDFEEQLDMKDRLIKRLQDQIKALQTHVTGKTLSI